MEREKLARAQEEARDRRTNRQEVVDIKPGDKFIQWWEGELLSHHQARATSRRGWCQKRGQGNETGTEQAMSERGRARGPESSLQTPDRP